MRAFLACLMLLLLPALVVALVGDPVPPAPPTPDPGSIPGGTGTTVGATYVVTILAPPAAVQGVRITLAYRHNASSSRTCIATLDDYDWEADDPRWENTSLVKEAIVAPNVVRSENFTNVLPGEHILAVYCARSDGTDLQEAFTQTVVSDPAQPPVGGLNASVTILKPGSKTGTDVNITFRHNATIQGSCRIRLDGTSLTTLTVPNGTIGVYRTTVSLGEHALRVECAGTAWAANASKTFRARAGDVNDSYEPTLRLQGGGAGGVAPNAPFTLLGAGFPSNDLVLLSVTGGGIIDEGEIEADGQGRFSVEHDGLPTGSYRITARSDSVSSALAVLLLTVRPSGNTTPIVPPYDPYEPPQDDPLLPIDDPWAQLPVDDPIEYPAPGPIIEQPGEVGGRWWLWLIPLLAILALVGGTGVYLAHEGRLDLSSWNGFQRSLGDLVHGKSTQLSGGPVVPGRSGTPFAAPSRVAMPKRDPTPTEQRTLRSFIARERQGGSDDLAIRGALLAKGWEKSVVDQVFDGIYREQKAAKAAAPKKS